MYKIMHSLFCLTLLHVRVKHREYVIVLYVFVQVLLLMKLYPRRVQVLVCNQMFRPRGLALSTSLNMPVLDSSSCNQFYKLNL